MAKKPQIKLPTTYPDCLKCKHGKEVAYGLIDCSRVGSIAVHPDCKTWKVACKFFNDKFAIVKQKD
jgi:hypothetical protein